MSIRRYPDSRLCSYPSYSFFARLLIVKYHHSGMI
jgi:hypothetical protein